MWCSSGSCTTIPEAVWPRFIKRRGADQPGCPCLDPGPAAAILRVLELLRHARPISSAALVRGTLRGEGVDCGRGATLRNWDSGEKLAYSPPEIKLARDCYDECIAYLDEQVGKLLEQLESSGLLANTVVVITADHGEHFGEHDGIFGHMYSLYGQEIRVPLVVIAPGRVPAGQVVSAPVTLRDLAATILDLAGGAVESSGRVDPPGSPLQKGVANATAARDQSGRRADIAGKLAGSFLELAPRPGWLDRRPGDLRV